MRTLHPNFVALPAVRIACAVLALAVVLALVMVVRPASAAAILTVTTINDTIAADSACSLREAIIAANTNADFNGCDHDGSTTPDTIEFNIQGGGLRTINLSSVLPVITDPVTINGLTQPGASCASWPPTLLIDINGGGIYGSVQIDAGGAGSTIRGLVIRNFGRNGILLNGGGNNTIQCNFIGTDVTGMVAVTNAEIGIEIVSSDNNLIGGTTPSARNLISGNGRSASDGNGMLVWAGETTNYSNGNLIQGNYIGADVTGASTLGNNAQGIHIEDSGNTVGGPEPGAGNLITNNGEYGIIVANATGTNAPANDTLIQGNTITNNSTDILNDAGVWITGTGLRNRVISNSMANNDNNGLDIGVGGFTPNDPGDPDGGANNQQNYPELSNAAINAAGALVINYSIDSLVTNSAYPITIEFFEAPSMTDLEGRDPLGFATAPAPGAHTATIPNAAFLALANGDILVATATDANGNTSEFSDGVVLSGGSPGANLAPAGGLNVGNQAAGLPSAVQFATLESSGTGPLIVDGIAFSGPFTRSGGTCPASFPATVTGGTSCTIGVVFTPTTTGAANGTLTVTDNASGSPRSITLSGTGVLPTATPTTLNFGNQLVGVASTAQTVTYENSGTGPVQISAIAFTGDFARSGGTCPTTLPGTVTGGTSCTIGVSYTPTAAGADAGSLSISDNAQGSPRTVTLAGTGVLPGAAPTTLTYSDQLVGVASAAQTVTYTNPGDGPAQISAITITGDFARSGGTCPTTLPGTVTGGSNCTIEVSFTPTTTGARTGTLSIADNAPGSPRIINLSGTGVEPSAAPTSLTFSDQAFGTTSAAQTVTLTNPGTSALQISGITLTGDFARSGGDCPTSFPAALAAGTSCTIEITFSPTAAGARTGTLSIADNAQGSPRQVPLSGTGLVAGYVSLPEPGETITLSSLIGGSNSTTIEVSNSGQTALNVSAPGGVSGVFNVTPATAFNLATGSTSQTVTITCMPTAAGPFTMNLSYTTNDPANPTVNYTVTCTGTTVATPGYGSTPAPGGTLEFEDVRVGSSALSMLTVRETGDAPLTVSNPVIGGTHASDFSIVSPAAFPINIPNGTADATIVVQCRPGGVGARTATLTLTTNDPANPTVTYTLSCTGTSAVIALPLIIAP